MREIEHYEASELVEKDPTYGNIICRCEKVSEAEIVEAVKRGHTTLDGVKFFTRTGMGRCQGGFCSYKIIKIIMRETGMTFDQITKRGAGSEILKERL
jgi:glycerol-3-phosphate dehydrogenase